MLSEQASTIEHIHIKHGLDYTPFPFTYTLRTSDVLYSYQDLSGLIYI